MGKGVVDFVPAVLALPLLVLVLLGRRCWLESCGLRLGLGLGACEGMKGIPKRARRGIEEDGVVEGSVGFA